MSVPADILRRPVVGVIGTIPSTELPSDARWAVPGDLIAVLDSDAGRMHGVVTARDFVRGTVTVVFASGKGAAKRLIKRGLERSHANTLLSLAAGERTPCEVFYLSPRLPAAK